MQPHEHSFERKRRDSEKADWPTVLRAVFPGIDNVVQGTKAEDLRGIDWWVADAAERAKVEVKQRDEDYLKRRRKDDVALETFSVVERGKVGWTLDPAKESDWYVSFWLETGSKLALPFKALRKAMQVNLPKWRLDYPPVQQFTPEFRGYHSECMFVDRQVLLNAIEQHLHDFPLPPLWARFERGRQIESEPADGQICDYDDWEDGLGL